MKRANEPGESRRSDIDGTWHILTGEYPPKMGGIADYSHIVAEGLANAGCQVHVWTTSFEAAGRIQSTGSSVTVHRETEGWKRYDLQRIGQALDAYESPRRILLQYTPNAFHRTGLNFELAKWLNGRRSQNDMIRIMFHEVTYIVKPDDPLRRRMLAFVQRRITARLLRAAGHVDIAVPFWEQMLRPLDADSRRPYRWLPIMSNVSVVADPEGIASVRRHLTSEGQSTLIGTFGTFASDVVSLLGDSMLPLLRRVSDRAGVLIGRGSERVAAAWINVYPELAGRLFATGPLEHDDISRYLQACDLLLQPYPGGASSKRGSLMAGLSHGIAIVTTSGELTEPIWAETGALALAAEGDMVALINQAELFLSDPEARSRLATAGLALYNNRFAARQTIEALIVDSVQSTQAETARL